MNSEQPPEGPQWRILGAERGADLAEHLAHEQEAVLMLGDDVFVFHRLGVGTTPELPWKDETEELTLHRMGSFAPLEEHERAYIAQQNSEAEYKQAAEKALSFQLMGGQQVIRLYRHTHAHAFAEEIHKEGLRLTIVGLLDDVRAASIA